MSATGASGQGASRTLDAGSALDTSLVLTRTDAATQAPMSLALRGSELDVHAKPAIMCGMRAMSSHTATLFRQRWRKPSA